MSTPPKSRVVEFGKDQDGPVVGNFLLIPAGAFYVSGSTAEGGRRLAVISRPFYMQETPVTQRQYQTVTGNPSKFQGNPEHPVEQVNWDDAVEFCRNLGPEFRLPTDMEGEWAARGGDGDKYKWAGSNDPDEVAWTEENSRYHTQPVKQKKPNGYGLYDMSGNVSEWCSDWYAPKYPNQELIDYRGVNVGGYRVYRGGSWLFHVGYARVASRDRNSPGSRYANLGFRLVMDIP